MWKLIVIVLIFIGSMTSCTYRNSVEESKKIMDEADIQKIPSESQIDTSLTTNLENYQVGSCTDLFLQITETQQGMVFPSGTRLLIRILEDGRTEYDDFEHSVQGKRETFNLSNSDMQHFKDFIASDDIITAKSSYTLPNSCVDTSIAQEIAFCPGSSGMMKKITIKECGVGNIEQNEKLPKPLSDVLQKAETLTIR